MAENIFEDFNKTLYRKGSPVYSGDGTPLTDISNIAPSSIGDGSNIGNRELVEGTLQSANFVKNVQGWQLTPTSAEIDTGTLVIGGTIINVSDITLLQTEIDLLSSLGGGIIALAPNTYSVSSSYTIPSNVTIDGNGATIDFGGGAYQFLIQGSNAYSTGTVTATFGSPNIVGVGTTWTAGMVGQSILLGDYWYTIATRTDNTHIALSSNFIGTNLSGDTYVIATTIDGASLKNITLQNASGTLLKFRYCNGFNVSTCNFFDAAQAVDGDDSGTFLFSENSNVDNCTLGITLNNVPFCVFDLVGIFNITAGTALDLTRVSNTAIGTISIQAVTGVAMKFTNCYDIGVINYAYIQMTSHGIEFASGNRDINISEGYIDTCGGDGIKLTTSSDNVQLFGNSLLNCTGYGINIADSTCDNNQLGLNTFTNNTTGNINDLGTNTFISPNDQYLIASQNLTAGQPVGISNISGGVALARKTSSTAAHGITSPALTTVHANLACEIGGDKFVYMTYKLGGDTLYAQVGSIATTTNTLTLGTAQLITADLAPEGTNLRNVCVCKLDTDKFIVFYVTNSAATAIKYVVGTVSGTTITLGSAATAITSGVAVQTSLCFTAAFLSTDKGVFCFKAATVTSSKITVFTVSGTTATFSGAAVTPGTNSRTNVFSQIVKIGTDKWALVTPNAANSVYGEVSTCSGTVITQGTEAQVSTATSAATNLNFQVVSPTTDVFVFRSQGSSADIALVGASTVSTRTITAGTPVNTAAVSTNFAVNGGIYVQSATELWIFGGNLSTNTGVYKMTLSGSTLTNVGTLVLTLTSPTTSGNNSIPIAIANSYPVTVSQDATNIQAWIKGMSNNWIGFSKTTTSKGSIATINIQGSVNSSQSGLVSGGFYLVSAGALSMVADNVTINTLDDIDVGIAIDSTRIII